MNISDEVAGISGYVIKPNYIGKRPLPTCTERIPRSQQSLPTGEELLRLAEIPLSTYVQRISNSVRRITTISQRVSMHYMET